MTLRPGGWALAQSWGQSEGARTRKDTLGPQQERGSRVATAPLEMQGEAALQDAGPEREQRERGSGFFSSFCFPFQVPSIGQELLENTSLSLTKVTFYYSTQSMGRVGKRCGINWKLAHSWDPYWSGSPFLPKDERKRL